MNYFNRFQSQSHSPSAPPLPESSGQQPSYLQRPPGGQLGHSPPPLPESSGQQPSYLQRPPGGQLGHSPPPPHSSPYSSGYSSFPSYGGGFPPGTHPDIIRSFQAVDRDRSGFIDEKELQAALSTGYQKFSLRTIRLLIFLFKNPNDPSPRVGPSEFAALWNCLGQWRAIFERFDRDRSGEIDSLELRDALLCLGYAVPPSVLQVLMSKYDDRSGRRGALNFDSFVECGMIVKGLTEKFKEKDPRYTGTATLTYDTFMSMIIPFIAS